MQKTTEDKTQKALISRLRRLEGQIRGITGMLEANRHKKDILIQLSAVRAGVSSTEIALIETILNQADTSHGNQQSINIKKEDLETILHLLKR